MNFSKEANNKNKKSLKSKKKKVKSRIGIIIFRVIFIIMILVAFAGIGGGLGVVLGIINTAPDIDTGIITPKGYTSIIYDQTDTEIDRLHGKENRIYATLDQIPIDLQHAFVAIEDERFYEHHGIDLKGIGRAIFVNIKNRSLSEGASTLTQQLIKNNALTNEKKFKRKIQEQYMAIEYEKKLTKDEILELYLNTIALGHGINGVQAAANRYFNKDVSDLTLAESTVIAGITQAPTRYSPILNPDNNKDKQKIILTKMVEQGYISESQKQEALKEDVYSKIQKVSKQYLEKSHHSYFVDQVIEEVVNDLQIKKGLSSTEANNLIYSGGLSIYTTLDQNMQQIVDKHYGDDSLYPPKSFELKVIYNLSVEHKDKGIKHYGLEGFVSSKEELEDFKKKQQEKLGITKDDKIIKDPIYTIPQPQSAMVIIDYHNGHVKALAGGRGDKLGNRTFIRATQAKRQPGSAFKVLAAYAPAIDTGKVGPATVIDDVPLKVGNGGGSKYIHNWNGKYLGLSTVREGIINSMNVLAVKTLLDSGIDTSFDYLQRFGFTTLIDREERNGRVYSDKNPVLALGGITDGVTPLELTAAYGAIANNGTYVEPIFYTKVLDHDGNILLEKTPAQHRVIKETTAFLLTDMMEDVVTQGTGKLARFKNKKMPIAGKTGTTSNDKDLTFAGYTPYYAAGIWMGHDDPKKMYYSKSYHNLLWSAIMEEIHKDLPTKQFEVPKGLVKARVCSESGLLATELCEQDPRGSTAHYEYFVQGTQPKDYCTVHVKKKICKISGLIANEYCPSDTIKEKVFIVRPIPYVPASENSPKPLDWKYEFPTTKEGEYCNVHGPHSLTPNTESDFIPFEPFLPDSSITDDPNSIDEFYLPQ